MVHLGLRLTIGELLAAAGPAFAAAYGRRMGEKSLAAIVTWRGFARPAPAMRKGRVKDLFERLEGGVSKGVRVAVSIGVL
ncbi:hypothetical protein EDB92DRAFT_1854610 [Lactarius akahatsu]|uniref:Uncharacterized protein n=1 Tax=Lactarius akahatsu TaxID=416441 RepID=A0AAD4QEI9_9AGAM|nr:hypothetical protein EDB92DRAFT_1854610 [Lactarius akahatsu]